MDKNPKKSTLFSRQDSAKSFGYAFEGIYCFLKTETNARFHLAGAVLAILLGASFNINRYEWIIIILCIAAVIVAEMLNTALEKLCDAVHPQQHPLIKATKDIASGAVLIAAIASAIVAAIIFLPKIIGSL